MRLVRFLIPFTLAFVTVILVAASGCTSSPGTVEITSTPIGAEVYIDGYYQGTTPITLTNVHEGEYRVELRMQGYQDHIQTMRTNTWGTTLSVNLIRSTPVARVTMEGGNGILEWMSASSPDTLYWEATANGIRIASGGRPYVGEQYDLGYIANKYLRIIVKYQDQTEMIVIDKQF